MLIVDDTEILRRSLGDAVDFGLKHLKCVRVIFIWVGTGDGCPRPLNRSKPVRSVAYRCVDLVSETLCQGTPG